MQPVRDRLAVCSCFVEDRLARRRDASKNDAGEVIRREPEAPLSLRPDVPCLQRWIDLNA